MSGSAHVDSRYCEAVYYPSVAPEDFRPGDDLFAAIPYLRSLRLSSPQALYQPPTVLDLCAAGAVSADLSSDAHGKLPTITLSVEASPHADNFREFPHCAAVGFLCAPERAGLEAAAEELRLASRPASDEAFWSEEYWRATQEDETNAAEAKRRGACGRRAAEAARASTLPHGLFQRLSTAARLSSPRGTNAANGVREKRGRSAAPAGSEGQRAQETQGTREGGGPGEEPRDTKATANQTAVPRVPAANRCASAAYASRHEADNASAKTQTVASSFAQQPAQPEPLSIAQPGTPVQVPYKSPAKTIGEQSLKPPLPHSFATSAEKTQEAVLGSTCSTEPIQGSKRSSTSAVVSQQREVDGSSLRQALCVKGGGGYSVPTPQSYKRQEKCCVTM